MGANRIVFERQAAHALAKCSLASEREDGRAEKHAEEKADRDHSEECYAANVANDVLNHGVALFEFAVVAVMDDLDLALSV